MGKKGRLVHACPICNKPISGFVIAEDVGKPKGFFGYHLTRTVHCEEGAWYHFTQNGDSKLAFIRERAKPR